MSTDNPIPDTPTVPLTEEQRAAMEAWLAAHPYGEQDENGIDLSALRRNLRLTPTERLIRLQQAANSLIGLGHAGTRD
jgi:hypothetical protein